MGQRAQQPVRCTLFRHVFDVRLLSSTRPPLWQRTTNAKPSTAEHGFRQQRRIPAFEHRGYHEGRHWCPFAGRQALSSRRAEEGSRATPDEALHLSQSLFILGYLLTKTNSATTNSANISKSSRSRWTWRRSSASCWPAATLIRGSTLTTSGWCSKIPGVTTGKRPKSTNIVQRWVE